jgi:hypothetical protein
MSTAPTLQSEITTDTTAAPRYTAWVWQTILLTLMASAAFAFLNYQKDDFGLHGRSPVYIYALERYSKYLMSYRYIPEHYDGILLSNSIAANWDTTQFKQHHVFNAGIRGGTITEEKKILDNVLAHGNLKIAIIVLMPSLTASHDMRSAYMTPQDYKASYGSIQTLLVDTQETIKRFGPKLHLSASLAKYKFGPDGKLDFPLAFNPSPQITPLDPMEVQGDPEAYQELRLILDSLHAHHVKVYGVYAPLYAQRWDSEGAVLLSWQTRTQKLFSPEDVLINLNDGQLAALEANRQNFPDYFHLATEAAAEVSAKLIADIEGR